MTWTAPEATDVDGSTAADERAMLSGYLAWQRSILLRKCGGLTGEQLAQRAVPPSSLSLLGLIRHLAKVERTWFRIRFAGLGVEPLFPRRDEDFDDIDADGAPAAYARLIEEMRLADKAVADAALDDFFLHNGQKFSVRFLYLHMIQEYARHNGHADLLRERIDGVTGA
ncbi:DinB family protein [Amycolatopsis sp. K13G38]|uniref:DinB family protein n=1 Tax=Amycolatopsis acididurans TaxID=2724524 RepID=A0ABX1J0L8_9PSEU|nr:DinB family protein [Amycolatopsis acididurans]NKQ53328.1 DinB family protein [Amycolatopsis acididurans]